MACKNVNQINYWPKYLMEVECKVEVESHALIKMSRYN